MVREYADYIDIDTYIDWWLVHELAFNGEPNHPKSTYMHKDRNGKLKAGPVWDFDWAYGSYENRDGINLVEGNSWYIRNKKMYDSEDF
jgi:hypothetical protein